MVLDLGSGSLFRPQGLEQETGLISDRWGQTGSTIKNLTKDLSTDGTVYTVTSGKRLFISSGVITDTAGANVGLLRDGGAGGTLKLTWRSPTAQESVYLSFPTPLYFDTDVYYDESVGSATGSLTLTGWEEDQP